MTPASPEARAYFRAASASYVAYGVLTTALSCVPTGGSGATPPLLVLGALASAAPVFAAVWVTARYLATEASALQRDIQVEALLWAAGVTFCIATAWGFLGRFAGAPQPPSYLAFAVFGSVVGSVQVARRLFPRRARRASPARDGVERL